MIKLNSKDWISLESTQQNVEWWHDGNGVQLDIHSIGFDSDLYPILENISDVREYYRDSFSQQGMGVVECELCTTNGKKCVKVVGKKIEKGKPGLYVGSLAIPLKDRSFVLSLYSQESGTTGVRDASIFAKLMSEGEVFKPNADTGKIVGWSQDPYFTNFEGPCLKNKSEEREYDEMFPEHPLSKVRNRIDSLPNQISIVLPRERRWKFW